MTASASYLYAVARDADDSTVRELSGIGGAPVRLVDHGELRAVVSDVDRAEFEARALEERLEDLTWLAATATAHHHVVDAVGREHVVAPLALATVYYDDDRIREVLDIGGSTFRQVLDQLTGRAEWGLKAWARAGAAGADERPRSGADYLRRRRQALRQAETALDEARQAAEDVDAAAADLAVASRRHRPQDAALTGSTETMVLNAAYLLSTGAVRDLDALVSSLAGHALLRLELTGPWVPYSFSQVASP